MGVSNPSIGQLIPLSRSLMATEDTSANNRGMEWYSENQTSKMALYRPFHD